MVSKTAITLLILATPTLAMAQDTTTSCFRFRNYSSCTAEQQPIPGSNMNRALAENDQLLRAEQQAQQQAQLVAELVRQGECNAAVDYVIRMGAPEVIPLIRARCRQR